MQEQFIELCKTLYNMFSEEQQEQELYHSIATVASLLLRIGEVGKKFGNGTKKPNTARVPPPANDTLQEEEGEAEVCRGLADAQLEAEDEPRDDTSVSSYSVVSAGSLPCEDITEDTVLVGASAPDADWSISFEQVLASMLTEPPLVDYFERKMDICHKMAACRDQRGLERQTSAASDVELNQNSI